MSKHSTTIILLFISLGLFSQESTVRLSSNTGVSFPLGKYAKKSLDGGSFALLGWNINIDGAWSFYKGMGAGIQAGYYAHTVDVASLAEEKIKSDPFLQELVIRSDPYRVITLAAFVQYSLNIANQFTFIPHLGGGATLGFSPYQLNKPVYFLVSTNWSEKTSTHDWGPYITAGGKFLYHVNDCIGIQLGTDFAYSKLVYAFLTGDGSIRNDVHQFMVLNVTAGFLIKF